MRGAGVNLATFGSDGMLIDHFSASGTNAENAIHLPSGDQRTLRGVSLTRVICVAGPSVSVQRTKVWEPFGSPSARDSSRFPSVDQRGADPFVRNRCRGPSAFRAHSPGSHLSSLWFTCLRA